jgi:hypothetical protein
LQEVKKERRENPQRTKKSERILFIAMFFNSLNCLWHTAKARSGRGKSRDESISKTRCWFEGNERSSFVCCLAGVGEKFPSADKRDTVFPIASVSTLFVFNCFDFAMEEMFQPGRRRYNRQP